MTGRRRLITPACLAFAAAAALPTGAGASTPGCGSLKGKDLVGTAIKVVRSGRSRYLVCARPHGRVIVLRGRRLEFTDANGAVLAVRDSHRVTLLNTVTGKRHRLRSNGRDPVGPVVVSAAGEAAALYRTAGGRGRLVGYQFDGTPYTLDSGAIGRRSLRHAGSDASNGTPIAWTKAGATRRANLELPAVPCSQLAGSRIAPSDDAVRIVSLSYRGEYLEGEVTGHIRRTTGCALPGGRPRWLGEDVFGTTVQGGGGYSILGVAGAVLLEFSSTEASGGESFAELTYHDLATDRRTRLWQNGDAKLGELADGAAVIASSGQAAGVFEGAPAGGDAQIVAFDTHGAAHVLDTNLVTADASSLAVNGSVLRWTHAGAPRSQDLAPLG